MQNENIYLMKKRNYNGYFTLEMALIFPMILCIIGVAIYVLFMVYGRTIASSDAYLIAHRAAVASPKDPLSYVAANKDKICKSQYVGVESPSVSSESSGILDTSVKVMLKTTTPHPLAHCLGLNIEGIWDVSASWEASTVQPQERVRLFTRVYDLVKFAKKVL
ncbi:hypothetical protein [Butyrivibrio sp. NC3005]|uniref:hypothetical protein n=1 Tax=Butyrivibrio sp. NC3005 TaxID=1280685 RepID=UPI0003FF6B19|nr:hypothetical protein [Butyrivibrio sp. NC3005]